MRVLVANLGSTSYKYRLLDLQDDTGQEGTLLARGDFERVSDHGEVIAASLEELRTQAIEPERLDGIGFKTVLGKDLSGCVPGDDAALAALDGLATVAPAHNPPYAAGLRQFARLLPGVPRYCLFETAFYQWLPEAATRYAVPDAWHAAGIRRYGFHGASHKANAERSAELLGRPEVAERTRRLYVDGPGQFTGAPLRVVSLHLGGSSSMTALKNGVAVATTMGFSPQSGLPQNNRVGDLDSMAIPFACEALGLSLDEARRQLNAESGLFGLSGGRSNDLRDIRTAAAAGDPRAALAIDFLIHEARRYLGGFVLQLGGLDAVVFSGGIGENGADLRARVLEGLDFFGLELDAAANASLRGEGEISAAASRVRVFVLGADEELVVAREVARQLRSRKTVPASPAFSSAP